jgi:polyphosphate kinase 2
MKTQLDEKAVEILNSKIGIKYLMQNENIDIKNALFMAETDKILEELFVELIKLQNWTIKNDQKIVVIFEGRDVAGKGGAIRIITSQMNPRHYRSIALPKPTEEEKGQWYFQRYVNKLPDPGEIVFFDRSWYNRAMVEPVNGFCTRDEYYTFMEQVNDFEKMIITANTYLIKFYFSISKEEQKRRFDNIKKDPLKKWKLTSVDEQAQDLWDDYTHYKDKMFEKTNTDLSPWIILDANNHRKAAIKAIEYILEKIPYKPF